LIGSVSLAYPFGRDQGIYAYAGKLLLEGKMNYKEVFDLKPPGIHFFFAAIQFAAGESMLSARIFDILWQFITAVIIMTIVSRLSGKRLLSILSGFIYIFLYYRLDYWHTLQADGALNLFFAISVLLLISSYYNHSFIKIFFAGITFAAALIFKYTIIAFLPLVLLCFLFSFNELKTIRLKNSAVFLAGLIFTVCCTIALYLLTGAFGELVNIQFVQTPLYTSIAYETESGGYISSQLVKLFLYSVYAPLIWLSVGAFVWLLIKKKLDFVNLLILSWTAASLFSLIIQWKFYYYHFLVIIAPLAVCSVYFVSLLIDRPESKKNRAISVITAILLLGFFAYASKPYFTSYPVVMSLASSKITLNDAYIKNGFTSDSVFMISKTFKAVDKVSNETGPADNIYVWGFDPLVYYLSGRNCTSRFIYNFPLLWKGENSALKKEFMNEVEKYPPKMILVAKNDPLLYISGYNEDSKQLLDRFTEFKGYLDARYNYETSIDDFDYYKLRTW
jgi:hypothetical protein